MAAIILWGFSLLFGLIIYVIVGRAIEKTGLKRLGATGSIWACDPDKTEKEQG